MDERKAKQVKLLNELIGHTFEAHSHLHQLLSAAGEKWPHASAARTILKQVDELDTKLRQDLSELWRPTIRIKPGHERPGRKAK